MNLKKKVFALVLCLTVLLSAVVPGIAFSDVTGGTEVAKAVDTLKNLGIIDGYTDGRFGVNDTLTRAQFAKIAVIMTGGKNDATGTATAFYDVDKNHWANGYINKVASLGYITGYPDGTFHPDEEISAAQAVTIMVRMLGFTGEDVGYNWPKSYMEKARLLGITDGLAFSDDDLLSRGTASIMLGRLLYCEGKDKAKLFTKMELTQYQDAVIYATKENFEGLGADEILTTAGTFKKGASNAAGFLGRKADLLVNGDKEIVNVDVKEQTVHSVVLNQVFADKINVLEGGNSVSMDIEADTTVYSKNVKGSFETQKQNMTEGTKMDVYMADGKIDYILLHEQKVYGPYTVKEGMTALNNYFSNLNNPQIIRNGEAATEADIEVNDIIYYYESTNRIYAYDNRVTGVYEAAYPLKSSLTQITVSGKTYEINNPTAKSKLDDSPSAFKIGDRITLLLGKDDEVCDVIDSDSSPMNAVGVILGTYTQISTDKDTEGKTEFITKLILGDGTTTELKSDKDYDKLKGEFVRITYENKLAFFTEVSPVKLAGSFDKANLTYAGHDFAQRYTILERVDVPSSGDATVREVKLADLDVTKLTQDQVLHVEYANSMGDIMVLYIDNVTKSSYGYGILTKADVINNDMMISATYEILDNGKPKPLPG